MRLKYWLDALWTACRGRRHGKIYHRPTQLRRDLERLEQRTLLTPTFSLEVLQDTAVEGAPNNYLDYAIFQINSTGSSAPPTAVGIQVTGSATPNSDYSVMPGGSIGGDGIGMIPFNGGQSSTAYYLVGISDYLAEGIETVHIELLPAAEYSLGSVTSIDLRIVDNTALVSVAASDPVAAENGGSGQPDSGQFTFTRTGGDLTQSLTVGYGVTGSADGGMDYEALSYQVFFPPNVTTVNVSVNPVNDVAMEPDETVIVSLSPGFGYVVDTPSSATVTIDDDDFTDATIPTVSVSKLGDNAEEDNSEGGVKDQTIRISRSGIGSALTVYYTLAGTSTNGTDYDSLPTGSIVIPDGESYVDLVVHPIWDTLVEGTETVTVTLSSDPYNESAYDVSATDYTTTVNIIDSAYPVVTIQASDPNATEMMPDGNPDLAHLQIAVNRAAQHDSHPVQVQYTVNSTSTATAVSDYLPLSGTIAIAGNATSGTIEIYPWWDKEQPEEVDESVIIDLTTPNGYTLGASTTATAWIHNTEISIISLSVTNAAAAEEGPNWGDPVPGIVNLHRVGNLSVPVTVYLGVGGVAESGRDFTFPSLPVTFPAGQSDFQLELMPIWDTLIEGDESVLVALNGGFSYLVDPNQNIGTIMIDDAEQPIISVTAPDSLAAEDAGNGGAAPGTWVISRTGGTTQPLSISYHLGGTATAEDYTTDPSLESGTIVIPAGAASLTIQLNPEWNLELEPDEVATLTIDDTDNYVLAEGLTEASITIDDADLPIVTVVANDPSASEQGGPNWTVETASYTISRTGNVSKALPVNISFSGNATSSDYTLDPNATTSVNIPEGQSSLTIILTPIQDQNFAEGDETRTLKVEPGSNYQTGESTEATITIIDAPKPVVTLAADDSDAREEGMDGTPETGSFALTRTGSLSYSLTVQYQVSGSSTATTGTDYTALSGSAVFAIGSATAQILVSPKWDELVELDETVIVSLSTSTNNTYTVGSTTPSTVTIFDRPVPEVSIAATAANASEEGPDGNPIPSYFRISRTGGTDHSLIVKYSLSGTAISSTDYGVNPSAGSATIPVGATYVDVMVNPLLDANNAEGLETVIATLTSNVKYEIVSPSKATITIADSPLPRVSVSATASQATEPASGPAIPGTFTVTRIGRINQSLTVQLALSGSATPQTDYTSNPSQSSGSLSVTFGPNETEKTITVTPVADENYQEGMEQILLTVNPSSNYTILSGQGTVNIADAPDKPTIDISAGYYAETSEGTGYMGNPAYPAMVTVTRTGRIDQEVTVSIKLSGSAATSDYTTTPSASNSTVSVTFLANETTKSISISAVTDSLVEVDEEVLLELNPLPAYRIGSQSEATVTIHDDHPTITVFASDEFANEGWEWSPGVSGGQPESGSFTFQRTGGNIWEPLTVSFSLGGTSTSDDYDVSASGSTSITFDAGQTNATLTVTPRVDEAVEPVETVVLTLSSSSSYAIGDPASGKLYIADRLLPAYTVTASDPDATEPGENSMGDGAYFTITQVGGNPNGSPTVSFTLSGSAVHTQDYSTSASSSVTLNNGSALVYITPLADDYYTEEDESVFLTLTAQYTSAELPSSAELTIHPAPPPNLPPTLSLGGVSSIDEAKSYALTVGASDVNSDDQLTISINWGDGSATETYTYNPDTTSRTHVFPDDNPTNTPSDTYTVTVTVDDGHGHSDSETKTITVNNIAPEWSGVVLDEKLWIEDPAHLQGLILDPGTQDSFQVDINWGDGSSIDHLYYVAGQTVLEAQHTYLQLPAGESSHTYQVQLTVKDDDQPSGGTTVTKSIKVSTYDPGTQDSTHVNAQQPQCGCSDEYWQAGDGETIDDVHVTYSTGNVAYSPWLDLMGEVASDVASYTMDFFASVNPHPIVGVDIQLPDGPTVPLTVDAQLTLRSQTMTGEGGTTFVQEQTFPLKTFTVPAGATPGDWYHIALMADASAFATGTYEYEVELTSHYAATPTSPAHTGTATMNGLTQVFNQIDSPLGNRWVIPGLAQIQPVTFGNRSGMAIMIGNATGGVYEESTGGGAGTYAALPGSFATLRHGMLPGEDPNFLYLDRAGGKTQEFDPTSGLMTRQFNLDGAATTFTYIDADQDGVAAELDKVTLPENRILQYTYTVTGQVQSFTDDLGRTFVFTYDGPLVGAHLTSITGPDPDGSGPQTAPVITLGYHPTTSLLASITDPVNTTKLLTYGTEDRRLRTLSIGGQQVLSLESAEIQALTTMIPIDEVGAKVIDADGQHLFQFDELGNVTREIDPRGNELIYVRNANGQVISATGLDPDGEGPLQGPATTYQYDTWGRLTRITFPNGTFEDWTYQSNRSNRPASHKSPNGQWESFTYNGSKLLSKTDFTGNTTSYVVANGLVTSQTTPDPDGSGPLGAATTGFEYDLSNRLYRTTYADGGVRTVSYDAYNGIASETDELGQITTYQRDIWGRVLSMTEPDPDGPENPLTSPTTSYEYDGLGRVTKVTNPAGVVTQFTYNFRDQILTTTRTFPAIATYPAVTLTASVTYNARGDITTEIDEQGNLTTYWYDDAGNLTTINHPDPDGSGPRPFAVDTFTYDGADRLTTWINPLGQVTTYWYNQLDQIIFQKDFLQRETHFTYDGNGNVISSTLIDPDGTGPLVNMTTTYQYDSMGRLTRITDPAGKVTEYHYDALGELDSSTAPDPDGGGSLTAPITTQEYDSVGNLIETIDPAGRVITHVYNLAGRVTDTTTPDGTTTHVTYDNLGRTTSETATLAGNSRTTGKKYNNRGQLESVTDPDGRVTTFAYDVFGNIATITLPDPDLVAGPGGTNGPLPSPVLSYIWDVAGNLLRTTTPDGTQNFTYDRLGQLLTAADTVTGHLLTYTYDVGGRITSVKEDDYNPTTYAYSVYGNAERVLVTNPAGYAITATLDALGRVISEARPGWGTVHYGYDLDGNLTSMTDAANNTTTYAYNAAGWLTQVTDALGGVTTIGYDQDGDVTSITDALGNAVTATYDALGRLISRGSGLNAEHWHYNARNQLDQYTDTLGRITSYAYDPVTGLLDTVTDPLGNDTTFEYDPAGRVTTIIGPDADGIVDETTAITSYTYDAAGRTETIEDALGGIQSFQYDAAGRLTRATDASGRATQFGYNTRGQVTSVTDPALRVTSYEYDALGNLIETTDPLGHITSSTYNTAGMLLTTVDAELGVTYYRYDTAGRPAELTDPAGNSTEWTYDALNRVATELTGFGTRSYTYDAVGNLASETDRLGRKRTFQYQYVYAGGPDYQLTDEKWLDGTTQVRDIAYSYDTHGLLQSVTDPSATYAYDYDALYRLESVSNAGTPNAPEVTLAYGYDTLGRRSGTSATVNGTADFVNTYSYDKLNRVTRITQAGQAGGNTVAPKRVDLGYTPSGQFDTIARYDDLGATQLVATSSYSYNGAGELTGLSHQQGATSLAGYSWTYDAAGRLQTFSSPEGATSYGYDDTDQLTTANHTQQADEAYSYDANGNRTMSGYTTGVGNRLTSDGQYNYAYDAEGHRTQRTEIATGAVTTYAWDFRQRLTEVTFKTSSGVVTKRVGYTYDAFDRLISKQVDANGDNTYESAERYVYDGLDVVLVADETGSLTNRYLHGPAIDQIFADEQLGGDVLWALSDNQGTVRDWAERDAATGTTNIVDHLQYDAYGQITAHTNPQTGQASTADIHYAYTGREWDADVGLYYYRARWYDPRDGRFISEDPLGFAAGDANVQRYVGNGPTNYVDPSGLAEMGPMVGASGGNLLVPVVNIDFLDSISAQLNPPPPPIDPLYVDLINQLNSTPAPSSSLPPFPMTASCLPQMSPYMGSTSESLIDEVELDTWIDYTGNAVAYGLIGEWSGADLSGGGFGVSIWASVAGVDIVKDLGDLGHSIWYYQFTWGHTGTVVLNAAGLIPVIGVVKPLAKGGELAADLAKSADDVACLAKEVPNPPIPPKVPPSPPTGEIPPIIYREGRPSPGNLTPRPLDEGHLSFRDSLSNPIEPGTPGALGGLRPPLREEYMAIDTSRLPPGSVVPDGVPGSLKTPPGHVSVVNVPPEALKNAVIPKPPTPPYGPGASGRFPK